MTIKRFFLSAFFFHLMISSLHAQTVNSLLKAQIIYSLTKYIEWPNHKQFKEFSIGVLGSNNKELKETLENIIEFKSFYSDSNPIPIRVKLFNSAEEIVPTQMLYLNGNDGYFREDLFNTIRGKGTLLIGENLESFNKSMINFIILNNKQRISINQKICQEENFIIDKAILGLAIHDETGWKDVFSRFNALLNSNNDNLKVSKNDLNEVLQTHTKLESEKVRQGKEIDKQLEQLKSQETVISLQKIQVNKTNEELKQKNFELGEKQKELTVQESVLNATSLKNQQLLQNIENRIPFLRKLELEIATQTKKIANQTVVVKKQKNEMMNQSIKIEKQKVTLELQFSELQSQKIILILLFGILLIVLLFASIFFTQRNKIKKGKQRSDELLLNILPSEVAEELKAKGSADAKQFDEVTVMFTDFKGFTQISEKLSPTELVAEIHTCFKAFDAIITKHNIEKIKTIGDAYMCAGGLPMSNTTHASDVVKAAIEIQQFMLNHLQERKAIGKEPFEIRIGIHTGPVVAGIVGVKKFAYDIWGDTVNIASRMESSGEAGKVNISGSTFALVKDKFTCTYRGKVVAKNKGEIDMFFIDGSLSES